MKQLDENKYTFDTPCDVNTYNLFKAKEFLDDLIDQEVGEISKTRTLYKNWILEIPSQLFPECFVFTYFASGVRIELNAKYKEDEWSLTVNYLPETTLKNITVWSPGA